MSGLPTPSYDMITFPPRCATIVHGGAFLTLNQSSYHIKSLPPEGGQPYYYQVGDHSPWWSLPPSPLASPAHGPSPQAKPPLPGIRKLYQKPNLSLTLSIIAKPESR